MNSIPSMLARAGAVAKPVLLASCLLATTPSWAGRDAGQIIAQDKANRDVIARRQAALDARHSPSASDAATATAAASAPIRSAAAAR